MDADETANNERPPAIILTSPDDLRVARLNQPRVSHEQLRKQRIEVQRQAEEYAALAKKETLKVGQKVLVRG